MTQELAKPVTVRRGGVCFVLASGKGDHKSQFIFRCKMSSIKENRFLCPIWIVFHIKREKELSQSRLIIIEDLITTIVMNINMLMSN